MLKKAAFQESRGEPLLVLLVMVTNTYCKNSYDEIVTWFHKVAGLGRVEYRLGIWI